MSRYIAPRATALVIAVAALTVGCGDGDASPPSATVPPGLDACADPEGADAESECLDQIERYIETNVAGLDDAVRRVTDVLSGASTSSYEFERVTPIGDGYDPVTGTEPIELYWKVGMTERTMFVCFGDGAFEVGPGACQV